jgi:hypothetical protein
MTNILITNLIKKVFILKSEVLINFITRIRIKNITDKFTLIEWIQKMPQGTFHAAENITITINKEENRIIYNNFKTEEKFNIEYNPNGIYKGINKCYYSSPLHDNILAYFCYTLISGEINNNNDHINKNSNNIKLVANAEKTILLFIKKISHLTNL